MRKVVLAVALAAVSIWAGGCRLFRDDSSRCCGYEPTPASHALPAP